MFEKSYCNIQCNLIILCLFHVHVYFQIIMYSLIEFPSNNGEKSEVEVVPNIWLKIEDEKWYCFWPKTISTKQIRKAIEKRYMPEKNWASYNCRLLHTCGKFYFAL